MQWILSTVFQTEFIPRGYHSEILMGSAYIVLKSTAFGINKGGICCSVLKLFPTLCDPMDCSMPCLPVPHHLLEFAQVHVHCIGDAIQPSHPLLPSSASTFPVRGCDMALLNNCEVGSRGSEGWERR